MFFFYILKIKKHIVKPTRFFIVVFCSFIYVSKSFKIALSIKEVSSLF